MARKRKPGKREPNGQLSRKREDVEIRLRESAREAQSVVIDARMRVFGMTAEQASKSTAGFALGRAMDWLDEEAKREKDEQKRRMADKRKITPHQMAAADAYYDDYKFYKEFCLNSRLTNESRPLARDASDDPAAIAKRAATVKARFEGAEEAIQQACKEMGTQLPAMAIENIVIRDIDMPRLYGDLRVALNHLVRHYLIGKRKAA